MRSLVLCEACKHHVKASEASCPFCGAAVLAPQSLAPVRARGVPGSRAALFLAGTALVAGCGDDSAPAAVDHPKGDGGSADAGADAAARDAAVKIDAGREIMSTPPYGISIPLPDPPDAAADAACSVPTAGDGGTCTDAGQDAGHDAGHDAGPIALPPYGIAIDPR